MVIIHALNQVEVRSEQRGDGGRIISLNRETAAPRGSVKTERGDDRGPSRLERSSQMCKVRVALLSRAEEVENRAIVPHVD